MFINTLSKVLTAFLRLIPHKMTKIVLSRKIGLTFGRFHDIILKVKSSEQRIDIV